MIYLLFFVRVGDEVIIEIYTVVLLPIIRTLVFGGKYLLFFPTVTGLSLLKIGVIADFLVNALSL